MFSTTDHRQVAWDIETTGFGYDDYVTAMGFWWPDGHADLLCNIRGDEAAVERYETQLSEAADIPVRVTPVEDETELLRAATRVVFDRFDRERNRLIAFNADSWKGGFDLPFLRTRCLVRDVDWPFGGVQFADLWEPIKKRMNTTEITPGGSSADTNDLTGTHGLLFGRSEVSPSVLEEVPDDHTWHGERRYDPFEDSGSAVIRHREGDHLDVLRHNLADVH